MTFDAKAEADRFEQTAFLGTAAEWRANLAIEFQRIYDLGHAAGTAMLDAAIDASVCAAGDGPCRWCDFMQRPDVREFLRGRKFAGLSRSTPGTADGEVGALDDPEDEDDTSLLQHEIAKLLHRDCRQGSSGHRNRNLARAITALVRDALAATPATPSPVPTRVDRASCTVCGADGRVPPSHYMEVGNQDCPYCEKKPASTPSPVGAPGWREERLMFAEPPRDGACRACGRRESVDVGQDRFCSQCRGVRMAGLYDQQNPCRACGALLVMDNYRVADGCPCNSSRGINHDLVPILTCTCVECDPAQTGSTRPPTSTPTEPEAGK